MERDRLELTTPEGVTLDLELAGVGSRSLSGIVDVFLQGLMLWFVLAILVDGVFAPTGNPFLTIGASTVAILAVLLGYHVLFEVYLGGQTPGKRTVGVRVVRGDGGPLGLSHSLIRTFLRIVDLLPFFYVVGLIAVFASTRNQRLGDMAAGTVVVMDRSRQNRPVVSAEVSSAAGERPMDEYLRRRVDAPRGAEVDSDGGGWDVSLVTEEEVAVVRRFLERRRSLDHGARAALAAQLAGRLREKAVAPNTASADEQFLAGLVRQKTGVPYR